MNIPFVDLTRQYELIAEEINLKIDEVLRSGRFILGEHTGLFEEEFAQYCNSKHAIGIASGTDALVLALKAFGIEKGDEVLTTNLTFIATASAIHHVGAKPVLVDIDPETYNLDVAKIEDKISNKTRAIIPVHLYGQPVDMEPVRLLAKKYGVKTIEDACQAHGARYKGKVTGSLGDIGCFSFYPSKNLAAYGDGGAVVTNDTEIAGMIKMLREHGQSNKYHHDLIGYNSRLDELQAAILRVKLQFLDQWNEKRREHAKLYNRLLSSIKEIQVPITREFVEHVYHLYVIRCKDRDTLRQYLASQGIQTGMHYPVPLHLQKACRYLGYRENSFPVAEECTQEILSLPMFPELEDNEIRYVCEKIGAFYE